MNFLRWTGVRNRPIYVEDIETVYESWRKLREHGVRVIYPSHGKFFSAVKFDKSAGLAVSTCSGYDMLLCRINNAAGRDK